MDTSVSGFAENTVNGAPNGYAAQGSVRASSSSGSKTHPQNSPSLLPSISLPTGGGAIRGIGEKFSVNPVTGTGSLTVPLPLSAGRAGLTPKLSLDYDSGSGNGPFGFGWSMSLPEITRKTNRGLPRYDDESESDVFILSGAEDLVPVIEESDGEWRREFTERKVDAIGYRIHRYQPRVEGLFARIERWTAVWTGEIHWRSITRDNTTSIYGKCPSSRIADPNNPQRVFTWLICESYDDTGNAIVYEYKAEDACGVELCSPQERNRTDTGRIANRYLKRVLYGNRTPIDLGYAGSYHDWMFELVLDYGEHDKDPYLPEETSEWLCRRDPFSRYNSCFEVRTYRLCQRLLMFHHFPHEPGVGRNCLVNSTSLKYQTPQERRDSPTGVDRRYSFISSIVHTGYQRSSEGHYTRRQLPPLELDYSESRVDQKMSDVDPTSLENIPAGVGGDFEWVDLDGEGLPGLLGIQASAWFYKPNLGGGRFGSLGLVTAEPSIAESRGSAKLMDVTGDGRLDVVSLNDLAPGYYERTRDKGWESLHNFTDFPTISWNDPNLRFVDLDGDGLADVMITQDEAFTWYRSLGSSGYAAADQVFRPQMDEEEGPRLVFADGEQSVYLADMSGDGLSDLIRVRNGEVCYWPNMGYGSFGAKITMDNSPWFAVPDLFDQRRIRLADVDGSGTADIIYLGHDGVTLYFNASGNSFNEPIPITSFPLTDNVDLVTTVDLMGNGTTCLVWSSPLASDQASSMRYIDLMGGLKPHLLMGTRNNLGAETRLKYAPSTKFFLSDKEAGRPWATRLPFPVQVVVQTDTYDYISRNRFTSRSAYHHGYYDGFEREFRGFGMVEQWDTQDILSLGGEFGDTNATNFDSCSQIPPIHTKTWFHVGDYIEDIRISRRYEDEYYCEPGTERPLFLPDSQLPPGLTLFEEREACRALKGSQLRREVYSDDGGDRASRPYTASESNFQVRLLQPVGPNKHASFFTFTRESLNLQYERCLYPVDGEMFADPREGHQFSLAVDDFGDVLESVSVAYGRRYDDPASILTAEDRRQQKKIQATYTVNEYTNPISDTDAHRTPSLSETRTFELANVHPSARADNTTNLFGFDEIGRAVRAASDGHHDLPFQDYEARGAVAAHPYRRLIAHSRTVFRKDDLSGSLPLGRLDVKALPYESYQLAFTTDIVTSIFEWRVTDSMLAEDGCYRHALGDPGWWTVSGRVFFAPDPDMDELAYARRHFFLPHRFVDPFGHESCVTYDPYDLLIQGSEDALGSRVTAGERDESGSLIRQGNDYRVLKPFLMMDANRNRSQIAFDAVGLVAGTAVMGKPEQRVGDTLEGFDPNLAEHTVLEHLHDPLKDPHSILRGATTRLVYDLFAYMRTRGDLQPQPAAAYTLSRETHVSDVAPGEATKIQHGFAYSDGFARVIQAKSQAPDGPLASGEQSIHPRWIGSGWTIFDNKGNTVRKYEPFFSATHEFQFGHVQGVSSILLRDPISRVVAVIHPDHTYEKTVFDSWSQTLWSVKDTILQADARQDRDVGSYFRRLPEADFLPGWYRQRADGDLGSEEQRAARQSAIHADTPVVTYADTLGRTFLTVDHNRFERNGTVDEKLRSVVVLDIQGNQHAVIDPLGRRASWAEFGFIGSAMRQEIIDAGPRWSLSDVSGKAIHDWDNRGFHFSRNYDELNRSIRTFVSLDGKTAEMVERTVYGESAVDAESLNLRGKPAMIADQGGAAFNQEYDFKGNPVRSARRYAREYRREIDWLSVEPLFASGAVDADFDSILEVERFEAGMSYDALNRVILTTKPDGSLLRPAYDQANKLHSLDARIRGASDWASFINRIDYNARGQRERVDFGNTAHTRYKYDPETFRLIRLVTTRDKAASDARVVQDLRYTYDPAGNITNVNDDADIHDVIYFRNRRVTPSADYVYDALSRLIEATGREHLAQTGSGATPYSPDSRDTGRIGLLLPGDGKAMGRYREIYDYDQVGNILCLAHHSDETGWNQRYQYKEHSNRLEATHLGQMEFAYSYDPHGNITSMPSLPRMEWDFKNQLHATEQRVVNGGHGETTYHVYDSSGRRVRKVTEGSDGRKRHERFDLGGFEVYREFEGDTRSLERQTLHIMDDSSRVALIDTVTRDERNREQIEAPNVRYQYSNHLSSATLELDQSGEVITYEEYYPYGATSFQAGRTLAEVGLKRYRFLGRERDGETGLYYCGARHYAPWLCRWVSTDPAGMVDGFNLYAYSRANPVVLSDPNGTQSDADLTCTVDPNDAANYSTFDEFQAGAVGPWTDAGLQAAWADAHGDDTVKSSDQGPRIDAGTEEQSSPSSTAVAMAGVIGGRSIPDSVVSYLRRTATRGARADLVESVESGTYSPQSLYSAERFTPDQLVDMAENGFPPEVEVSHLEPLSTSPEVAANSELTVVTDEADHFFGHHGGNYSNSPQEYSNPDWETDPAADEAFGEGSHLRIADETEDLGMTGDEVGEGADVAAESLEGGELIEGASAAVEATEVGEAVTVAAEATEGFEAVDLLLLLLL